MVETLQDASLRIRGSRCTFICTRLQPGVLLTTIRGADSGELGEAVLRLVTQEHHRFHAAVSWFIDAREAVSASPAVLALWTQWFKKNVQQLEQLHVLPGNAVLALNIGIARHLSSLHGRMTLHDDAAGFAAAVERVVPRAGLVLRRSLFDQPAVKVMRQQRHDGSANVAGPGLSYAFSRRSNKVVLTVVKGAEHGGVGDVAMDTFDALLERVPGATAWWLDLRALVSVSADRAAAWSAWLAVRAARFTEIVVLAPSPAVEMFLLRAQYRVGARSRLRVLRSPHEFDALVA